MGKPSRHQPQRERFSSAEQQQGSKKGISSGSGNEDGGPLSSNGSGGGGLEAGAAAGAPQGPPPSAPGAPPVGIDACNEGSSSLTCEGPPPLRFLMPPTAEGGGGAPSLLWEIPYSCGNPAVERISGVLRYLNAIPRSLGGASTLLRGPTPTLSSGRGPSSSSGVEWVAPEAEAPSGDADRSLTFSSTGEATAAGVDTGALSCEASQCGAPSLSTTGVGPPPSLIAAEPQGGAGAPSLSSLEEEASMVVLVAPRIPTYVPPAAFCGLLLSSKYAFLQAKVLQGPLPSEYLLLLKADEQSAVGALRALNGVFFGGALGAFCDLRIVKDLSLKVQARKGGGGPAGGALAGSGGGGGPLGDEGPCPFDPRAHLPSFTHNPRGAPARQTGGPLLAPGANSPSTPRPIGSTRGPRLIGKGGGPPSNPTGGGPRALHALHGGGPSSYPATPSSAAAPEGTSGRGSVGILQTHGGGPSSEAFLSPLELMPRYDSLHFCAVCLERLVVSRPPPPTPTSPTAAATAAAAAAVPPGPCGAAPSLHPAKGAPKPRRAGASWREAPEGLTGIRPAAAATAAAGDNLKTHALEGDPSPALYGTTSPLQTTGGPLGGAPPQGPDLGKTAPVGLGLVGAHGEEETGGGGGPPAASGVPGAPATDMPLSVLCGHSFHVGCLQKWRDNTCPVCRYQQHPLQPSCCSACDETEGLLTCLVCGFTGCGGPRTKSPPSAAAEEGAPLLPSQGDSGAQGATAGPPSGGGPLNTVEDRRGAPGGQEGTAQGPLAGHAFLHFQEMSHSHALEGASNRVFDFTLGSFVDALLPKAAAQKTKRLIAANTQADAPVSSGAPDELRGGGSGGPPGKGGWISEFNQILAASLESQELYYQKLIRETERILSVPIQDCRAALQRTEETVAALEEKLQLARADVLSLEAEEGRIRKETEYMRERLPRLRLLIETLSDEARERRQRSLQRQQEEAKRVSELQDRIAALKQEAQDLRFHISAAQRLAGSQETREGLMLIGQRDPNMEGPRARGGRRRGRPRNR